jgi:hypothetical protein
MDRRMRTAAGAAVAAMLVLVLAASSGSLDVWRTTSSGGETPTVVTDAPQIIEPQQPGADTGREWPSWVGTLVRVIGVTVAALALLAALAGMRLVRMPSIRWPSALRRRTVRGDALPATEERRVVVDVDSARAALTGGTPRNAIVACWMQLEVDAAAAGLSRLASETSTEYVERVIGGSSVDPVPIGDLAALYREARFSRHPLVDEHRDHALVALEQVAAALLHAAESAA